jgi:molybdenum cofactor biosynthesis enzyme MoaA
MPNDFAGEIATGEWLTTINRLAALGVRIFVFEGGEPTLRRDLPELLAAVSAVGGLSIVATNGFIEPWHLQASAFTVSVDGPAELHDSVRGSGSFRRLSATLKKRDSRAVIAIHVVTQRNHRQLAETVASVRELVDGFLFTFEYPYKLTPTSVMSVSEIADAKEMINALKSKITILNPTSRLQAPTGTKACHDWLAVSVDHTGIVKHGCFVQQIEPRRCEVCELGCFQVISSFLEFELAAWLNFSSLLLRRPTPKGQQKALVSGSTWTQLGHVPTPQPPPTNPPSGTPSSATPALR